MVERFLKILDNLCNPWKKLTVMMSLQYNGEDIETTFDLRQEVDGTYYFAMYNVDDVVMVGLSKNDLVALHNMLGDAITEIDNKGE